jgi:hypothetical protein
VVCDPSINSNDNIGDLKRGSLFLGPDGLQYVNYQIEDWSGYQFQPPNPDGDSGNNLLEVFEPGPAAFFESKEPAHEGDGCVATTYKSLNPGLSRIRVDVRSQSTGAIVFSHQFLVIWLTANKPTVNEASLTGNTGSGSEVFQSQLNSTGKANLAKFLGDPSGNGEFTPSPLSNPTAQEDKGLVQIKVTGSFPVVRESPLSNILTSSSYTLPHDWVALAETLSSSSEETEPPGTNAALWDIHGTPGRVNGNEETAVNALGEASKVCTTGSIGSLSATDNCNGTGAGTPLNSQFSRVFGDLTSGITSTVGPYDPEAANQTLLSDGELNENDAPMPAMRIDVSIAANKGAPDLGGVGQISAASKALIYSHDFTGATTAHNLYNPYYGAYIPATDRGLSEASGVTGPSPGGDFPGFLNKHPEPYVFWTPVLESNKRISHETKCLRDTQHGNYWTPSGPLTETFYTDERGEAYVTYTPGDAFYLENLPVLKNGEAEAPGKIITNLDGACDLKLLKGLTIGESAISAKAIYPYEPVDYPAQASTETLKKTIKSQWEKEWFVFGKGPGKEENSVRIIVAKAQGIDGRPLAGETVCFATGGLSSVYPFTGTLVDEENKLGFGENASINLSGTTRVTGEEKQFCETTNSQGLAAIEVDNGSFAGVDLTATYINEGVIRDHAIEPKVDGGVGKEAPKEEPKKEVVTTPTTTPTTTTPTTTTITTTITTTSPLIAPIPTPTPSITGGAGSGGSKGTTHPLTAAQQLANALKACKKLPKSKRAACVAKAEKAYAAKTHKKKKK